ncbi:MAG TPA: hypothetical protein IAC12_04385 [Candidatus Aphodovivens avistercoris]|nr:hypothetical protein [Candidatus Aphodovivens avistercoris]
MLDLLFIAVIDAAFIFIPGYCALRAFAFSRVEAMSFSPFVAVAAYSILAAAYAVAGIQSSWFSLIAPVAAVDVVLIALRAVRLGRGGCGFGSLPSRSTVLVFALYVVFGVAVSLMVFIPSICEPDAFVREYDNIHHLGITYGYLHGGDWSSFDNTLYPTADDQAMSPFDYSGYYPSAWNCIAAMGGQLVGASAAVSVNAMNLATIAFVFPLCMFCFMRVVFAALPSVIPFGALLCLAFGGFPWAMLVYGPLYPNMFSFAMLPAMLSGFILLTRPDAPRWKRAGLAISFCTALLSCVFSQPNSVFAAAALLIPFCVYRIAQFVDGKKEMGKKARVLLKMGACAAFLAFAACVWLAFNKASFMQGVVSHNWPAFRTLGEALADVVTGSYRLDVQQGALMFFVAVGIVAAFFDRRFLWIVFSWLLSVIIYIVGVSTDAPIKQLLSGFWYNDSLRVAAFAVVAAVPLASFGLWTVSRGTASLVKRITRHSSEGFAFRCVSTALLLVAGLCVFRPFETVSLQYSDKELFPHLAVTLNGMYNPQGGSVYDRCEKEFVEGVKSVIPEGALVINVADDGSAFAYAVDGLNVYYRYLTDYDSEYETADSQLIRNGLANIASDVSVREAVARSGAEYVMFLDWGEDGLSPLGRSFFFTYGDGWKWRNMLSVNDETPGFELVLSRDDMRLYRIDVTG